MYLLIMLVMYAGNPELAGVFDTQPLTQSQCHGVLYNIADESNTYVKTSEIGLKYVETKQDGIEVTFTCADLIDVG